VSSGSLHKHKLTSARELNESKQSSVGSSGRRRKNAVLVSMRQIPSGVKVSRAYRWKRYIIKSSKRQVSKIGRTIANSPMCAKHRPRCWLFGRSASNAKDTASPGARRKKSATILSIPGSSISMFTFSIFFHIAFLFCLFRYSVPNRASGPAQTFLESGVGRWACTSER